MKDMNENKEKDLILLGTYIPDLERENLLSNCLDSLQECRDKFDIIICSHSHIPKYISEKCDYVIIENNNDLIFFENLEYMNQPWFSPYEGFYIKTTTISKYSTFLSCYRLLILGIGFADTYKYKKIHYIEYDSVIMNNVELYENSKLLEDFDAVFYSEKGKNGDNWFEGNYFCFLTENTPNIFKKFDRKLLLDVLKNTKRKSNEYLTYKYFTEKNKNIFVKHTSQLENKMMVALSEKTQKDSMSYWTVPFFDRKESKLKVVSWNNKNNGNIDVVYIINDNKVISHKNLNEFNWVIDTLGDIEEINKITILLNDNLKTLIDFSKIDKEIFIKTNYGE